MSHLGRAPEARFWEKVDKRGPDECWPWIASPGRKGYGQFWFMGAMHSSHRVSYYLANGHWPDPCCCHRCDNPACVNPGHLFVGTQSDNVSDMRAKGRHVAPRGERHCMARLTDKQVMDIRANALLCRVTNKELAARFGIGESTVSHYMTGRSRPFRPQ